MPGRVPSRTVRLGLCAALLLLIPASSALAPQHTIQARAPFQVLASNLSDPTGLAWDPTTGNLYVSEAQTGVIVRITPAGAVQTFASGFKRPRGIARDPRDGSLVVVDEQDGTLKRIAPSGAVTTLRSDLDNPHWVAVAADGTIYLTAEQGAGFSLPWNEKGVLLRLAQDGTNPQLLVRGLKKPEGIRAICGDRLRFLAERLHNEGERDGGTLYQVGPDGFNLLVRSGFKKPHDLALDALDATYLSAERQQDTGPPEKGVIAKAFSLDGVDLFATGLTEPQGLAFDAQGTLYVAETDMDRVLKFLPPAPPTLDAAPPAFTNQASLTLTGTTEPNAQVTGRGGPAAPLPPQANVSAQVTVQLSSVQHDAATGTSIQGVTLTNNGPGPLSPLAVLITSLTPAGVTLANATGTFQGNPFLAVPVLGGFLRPGDSTGSLMRFNNPGQVPFAFTHEVWTLRPLAASDAAGRFSLSLRLTPNASNDLEVFATAAQGLGLTSAPAQATVIHDDTPPAVSFLNPADGSTVGGTIQVAADAQDANGITSVSFFVDGAPRQTLTAPPFQMLLNTTALAGGPHTLGVQATDQAGNTSLLNEISVIVANAPSLTGFSPTSGRVGGQVTFTGTHFIGVSSVAFNGVPAPGFTVLSATSIQVNVPPGASTGPLSVTTAAGTAISPGHFVVLPTQDFQLSVAPNAIPIPATGQAAFQASLTGSGGFTNLATLTVSGLPAGATAAFGAAALTAGQSTMLTVLTNGTNPGSYPITVTATGLMNGVQTTRSANVTLQVQPAGATSLAGQFLTNEDVPIPNVKVQIGTVESRTDAAGNFLLQNVPAGTQFLMVDANVAVAGLPIYQVEVALAAGQTTVLPPFRLTPPPPPERFTPFNNATQDQVFTDARFPGVEITLPKGATVIGWDGIPKSKLAIERLTADKLPIPAPPGPTRSLYQIYFGTPMGGIPSAPLRVTAPNDLGLDPGDKPELWFYDAAPGVPIGSWQKAGLGTVSADGSKIVSDPGVGITRFCGVCGTWCWIPINDADPNTKPGNPKGGEPVDLATGLFTIDKTDMVLPGRVPVVLSRSYNPIDPFRKIPGFAPSLGPGWALSVDIALLNVGDSGAFKRLILPGNARFDFRLLLDVGFINTTDPLFAGAVLTVEAGGSHRLRFKDGTTWQFAGTPIAGLRFLVEQADRNGNRVTVERSPGGTIQRIVEPAGRAIEVAYTGSRISQITDPIGRTVRYGYEGGRLATVTDPSGGVTRYTYDSDGRILTITDPKGIGFIRNEYSPLSGRVLRQVQADGGVWSFRYLVPPPPCPPNVLCYLVPIEESTESVAAGLTLTKSDVVIGTKVVDPRGNATTYRFGANVFTFVMNALGQFTTFERDARSQLLSTTDPLGRKTSFTYDSAGNVTTITDPAGNLRTFTYEPMFNRVTSITDPLGNVTTFEYDSKANLTAITDPEQNLKPEPDRLKTRIAYNQFGQPESTTDPLGNTTGFAYNAQGDLATISDPLGNTTTRTYDAVSRLIRQTDPRGAVTRFNYDPLNRLTTIIDALGGQTSFSYDPNSNLLTVTDARNNTINYEYDSMDRLARRTDQLGRAETFTYDFNANLASTTDRKGQTNRFTYDRLSRRTKSEFADGAITEFQYDAGGRLVKADDTADPHRPITLGYDILDRLEAETAALGTVKYQYDQLGRRRQMTVSGQEPVDYDYDRNSRLRTITQSPLSPVRIDYDPAGRRTVLILPNDVSTEYKYDNASRLTDLIYRNALGALGDLKYQYDAAGNRIVVGGSFARTLLPDPVSPTGYDAANQQGQFGNRQMTFDANGNLSSMADPSGLTQFTWDARDRLIALTGPGTAAAFAYDSLGRRASKQINGLLTRYAYDGLDIVQELGNGPPINSLRTQNIDELLVRNGTEYRIGDALGSSVALTDSTGAVPTEYTYEPFGRTIAAGMSTNPFQYTGRENDATGLYYYRARYYSPPLHRFLSEDPLGFGSGDVVLYAYVGNSPTKFTDSRGREKEKKGAWPISFGGGGCCSGPKQMILDIFNPDPRTDSDCNDLQDVDLAGCNAQQQACYRHDKCLKMLVSFTGSSITRSRRVI